MLSHWQPIAQNISAIAADRGRADDLRSLAMATLDLLTVVATWPAARWQRFDDHLACSVFRLCRSAEHPLCGAGLCPAEAQELPSLGCPIILEQLAVIDSYATGGIEP